jgi:Mrp family chromosome partitioning ATPase
MSNYFQTLNRLEREKSARRTAEQMRGTAAETVPTAAAGSHSATAAHNVVPPASVTILGYSDSKAATVPASIPPVRARRRSQGQSLFGATNEAGKSPYLTLFDNLRLLGNGGPVKNLVMAGAVADDRTVQVSSGLALLARRRGLRVLVADIVQGVRQPVLRPRNLDVRDALGGHARRRSATDVARSAPSLAPIALDLRGGPIPAELSSWLQAADGNYDLVIVEAPALARTVDGALLARACDGLILVVDSQTTTKDALCSAVDRAEAVGCRVLGLVMNGAQPTRSRRTSRDVGSTTED